MLAIRYVDTVDVLGLVPTIVLLVGANHFQLLNWQLKVGFGVLNLAPTQHMQTIRFVELATKNVFMDARMVAVQQTVHGNRAQRQGQN